MKQLQKWAAAALVIALLALPLSGCSGGGTAESPATNADPLQIVSDYTTLPGYVDFDEDDLNADWSAAGTSTEIAFSGDSIAVKGNGAVISGTTVTVTSPGLYHISGTLNDGQLIVNSAADGKVWLVLDGAQISCSTSAALWIQDADKTVLTLADGSENALSDGAQYVFGEGMDEPNAALFSKDDLTINGGGVLTVTGNYANGIQSKDDLRIAGGTLVVSAVNNGIKGKDRVGILDGTINVSCGGNGIQSDNDTDATLGVIYIAGGSINASAGEDGIEAYNYLLVTGGDLVVTAGGGSANATSANAGREDFRLEGGGFPDSYTGEDTSDTASGKALKADVDLTILGGTITVDSADDAVHSNGSVTLAGGSLSLSSGDDGVHADLSLTITGGTIDVLKSYEGLESAQITLAGGAVSIVAEDDGVNAADGTQTTAGGFGAMGGTAPTTGTDPAAGTTAPTTSTADPAAGTTAPTTGTADPTTNDEAGQPTGGMGGGMGGGSSTLTISGGVLTVNAGGDGLDANGSIYLSGGEVYVEGPLNDGNSALDYDGAFEVTGGLLVATGSAGMAQTVSSTSGLCGVTVWLDSEAAGGTTLAVLDASGATVLSRTVSKAFAHAVIVSPALEDGAEYTVQLGGETAGTFTADDAAMATVGSSRGGMSGFGNGMGGMGGGRGDRTTDGTAPDGTAQPGGTPPSGAPTQTGSAA